MTNEMKASRPSISRKIGAMITILSIISALIIGLSLDFLLQRTLHNRAANELNEKLASIVDVQGLSSHRALPLMKIGHPDMHWAILDKGIVLLSSDQYAEELIGNLPQPLLKSGATFEFRGNLVGSKSLTEAKAIIILDVRNDDILVKKFREYLSLILVFTTISSAVISMVIARKGLQPLAELSDKMKRLSAHSLDLDIREEASPAEFEDLIMSFNKLIEQIKSHTDRLSQFSGDLSHEMRTPLCKAINTSQQILSLPRANADYINAIQSIEDDLLSINRLIADMLYMAHTEEHNCLNNVQEFNIRDLAFRAIDFYEALAEERSITLSVKGDGRMHGDKQMILRAIINILSNAIRHANINSEILIGITEEENGLMVSISNEGQNIPTEHLPRLTDRFYRVDSSRNRHQGGAGLGLAIVGSILRIHDASLTVVSEGGITAFTMIFKHPKHDRTVIQ